MGLEAANYLSELVLTNPTGSDFKYEGDNHLRMLKTVLQNTLPGMSGRIWRKQTKNAGYTPVLNDQMSWLDCTTALTLSLTAAATLGNGWLVLASANGGDVTIDPNAAETINGAATIIVPDGWDAAVRCDGSNFTAIMTRRSSHAMAPISRAANTILTLGDVGKVIRATAGFTQTFDPAATLRTGWFVHFKIDTGVTVVFDPNGAETIDGAATRSVTGPAAVTIVSDGTNLISLGGAQADTPVPGDTRADVASAATTNIGAANSRIVRITGTTDITAFDNVNEGIWRLVYFEKTGLKITYNATSMQLPIPYDIQVMVGDSMLAQSLGSGNWKVHYYQRADGQPLLGGRIPFTVVSTGALNAGASATDYSQGVGTGLNSTEVYTQIVFPEAVTVSELRVFANAILSGGTCVVTVRKNATDTALVATVANGTSTGSDLANSVDFGAGDTLTFKWVRGAIGSTTDFGASVVVKKRGLRIGVPLQFAYNSGANGVSNTMTRQGAEVTESDAQFPVSACRIQARAPRWASSSGLTGAVGPTVRRDGVGGMTTGSIGTPTLWDNGTRVTGAVMAKGPLIDFPVNFLYSSAGTDNDVNNSACSGVYDCLGPSDGQYPPSSIIRQARQQAQNLARFATDFVAGNAPVSTESEAQIPMPACTLRNLRVAASSAMALGSSTIVVRKNGVDTGLTVSPDNSGRVFADTTNSVEFAAGDLFSLKVTSGAAVGTRTYVASIDVNPALA